MGRNQSANRRLLAVSHSTVFLNVIAWSRSLRDYTKRNGSFLVRIATPDERALRICPIPGCGRKPQARVGKGASQIYCHRCCRHRNRHGDLVKSTYSAAQLRPYILTVQRFVAAKPEDLYLLTAETNLARLLQNCGSAQRVADLQYLPPTNKARAALARMRTRNVHPKRLLTITLAVSAAVLDDPVRPIGIPGEFRTTQIGKRALRTASGYHAVYGPQSRYDRYPRSAGRMLRLLGKQMEEAADPAMRYVEQIIELKGKLFSVRQQVGR